MQNQPTFITPPPFSFLREEYQKNSIGFLQFLFKTFPITEVLERIRQMEFAHMANETMKDVEEGEKEDALLFTHLLRALMEASFVIAYNPVDSWYKKSTNKNHVTVVPGESKVNKIGAVIKNVQTC